ncbi:dihydroflavonol-4-reductase [Sporobacter termitidis DSM 10068]|uniref:Dihydroflavonol-4-reductase n=1 Tax=Sporobacter termitidis DSM 10068 TaxID=1123282 RepID=A0A1M5YNC1_9FIRM|nr:NAD-dependent epimerase/dehydratase family protein [Sporobacter termitidis]SHI13440.1 dihydroflavonol-4-reductase [Sporobacter termitidis DSM 10068]
MRTKYLVTGAAGHLGSAVVRELISSDLRDIRVLVMPGDKAAARLPDGVEQVKGDLLDKASLSEFFAVPEETETIVIHCAGIVSTSMKASKRLHDVNVGGTKNIVDMCVQQNVKKLVYVSSIHAMPTLPDGQPMSEIETFDPAKVVGPYAKTKAEATAYVKEAVKNGLNATIVYPCGILGPYDYGKSNNITQLIIAYCMGKMPVGLKSRFDFVDVRDVAKGIAAAAQRGGAGEGYILGNRQVSVSEMFDLFHKETGGRRTRFFAPMWLARAGLPLTALYYRFRRQQPLFCAYSLHTLGGNSLYSHAKASRDLGYRPRPFEETIRDTIAWLKGEGRI